MTEVQPLAAPPAGISLTDVRHNVRVRVQPKASGGGGASYSATVIADGPVAYYRLNDTTTAAVDQMGGPNGTYVANYTQNQPSLLPHGAGACTSFTTGDVTVPDNPATRLGAGNMSVECWFNVTAFGQYAGIFDQVGRMYSCLLNAGGNPAIAFVSFGGNTQSSTPITSVAIGTTYHFVAVMNSGTMIIYQNGVATFTGPFAAGSSNSSTGVAIAGNPSGGGGNIDAKMQEFALYNKALSAAQVLAHYNAA